jgi:hypothetical protein
MVLRLSIALSLVALIVLAGLQYQWIGQIASAERQRLERGVAEAANYLAEDFTAELRQLTGVFEPRFQPVILDPVSIATRYHYWATSATYPNLLKSLYIVRPPSEVLRMNRATEEFAPDTWPPFLPPFDGFAGERGRTFSFRDVGADVIVMPLNRRTGGPRGGLRGGPPGRGLPGLPGLPKSGKR